MEQIVSDIHVLESIVQALEVERSQLEEKLQTELEDSERQTIEERIAEIHADLEIQRVGLANPSSQGVRRSEREKHPTEKMLELRKA